MKKEFLMRGQTASGLTEVLNFSGFKKGYAYRLIEFQLYPTTNIGGANFEMAGTITAGKTAEDSINPNFNNEGLIATTHVSGHMYGEIGPSDTLTVINDTFLITQDLILMVKDTKQETPVNWQCRFVSEKMNLSQEAVANYNQFTISDG